MCVCACICICVCVCVKGSIGYSSTLPSKLTGVCHCNDWSKACGSMCSKMFNRQNQTGKGQRAKTGISEAGQRRKQYQAEVGVTGTGSEFQGRAVRGQTQR